MKGYEIDLTPAEQALLDTIELRDSHFNHAVYLANKEPVLALLRSLIEREAIPDERLNYWLDPDYNVGVSTSRKGVFDRNRRVGEEIYTHPHFLRYLRYFLFGADLPELVVQRFEEQVGNPEWVTSGDVIPIANCARTLTRQFNLDRTRAPEEFFKLSLDVGLDLDTALQVRRTVMRLR